MPVYGATKLDRAALFKLLLRFIKDGGDPAAAVASLREAMHEEGSRLGLAPSSSWVRSADWLNEVETFLKEHAVRG